MESITNKISKNYNENGFNKKKKKPCQISCL